MSAQNPQSQGTFGAVAGMLGFSVLAGILVAVMVTPGLAVTSMAASNTIGVFDGLPENLVFNDQPQENKITAIDAAGVEQTIATVYSQNREEVKWDEVAQVVKDATVAGEDRRFYSHGGVDVQGLVRAALANTVAGGVTSGASTLSMQLVKNIYIQDALQLDTVADQKDAIAKAQDQSIARKLKEMKLAIGLEKRYTKDEILLAYLNIAGFGNNTYGIQAAAQRYYGVNAADLDLAQAASLIAIVQQPGARSLNDPEHYAANLERRNVILGNMRVENMITDEEYKAALAVPVDDTTVHLAPPTNGCIAAAITYAKQFCDYVVKSVKDLKSLGDNAAEREEAWKIGGYTIHTTLNLELQALAEQTVKTYAPAEETKLQLGASSVVLENKTGRIIVMAQNKGFDDTLTGAGPSFTAINFNTDQPYGGSGGFQAGSTYKIFTLLNWLNAGHGLNEVVDANARTVNQASFLDTCDGPYGDTWKFRNDSGETGTRTVMAATARSVNGAYISMALKLDQCQTKLIAQSLGVHTAIMTDNPDTTFIENKVLSNPAMVMGSIDLAPMTIAGAYAALANNGTYCKPIAVDSITNSKGEELPGQAQECNTSLIDPEVAAGAILAFKGAMNGYNANPRNGIQHMGKTGTTSSSKQTWVTNSTTETTSVTWVGNIIGDYPIRSYRNAMGPGTDLRHRISKIVQSAVDGIYGGSNFPDPPPRLLTGTGVTLDDFLGQTVENAKSIIEARGLVYADGGQVDSDRPVGQVASTDPAPGTVMASGMTVTVYTSNGSMSVLPDVVSGNPSFGSAQSTLSTANFTNVTQYCAVTTDNNLVNKVIASQPTPGSVYRRDNEVKLGVGQLVCP